MLAATWVAAAAAAAGTIHWAEMRVNSGKSSGGARRAGNNDDVGGIAVQFIQQQIPQQLEGLV